MISSIETTTNTLCYGNCIIFYTTQRNNEFGYGREGAQFGFWLKEENGKLKLSGLEMIP
ncbi:hypothetical protein [Pedobacter namyangjuensis]|uniref:hypothetical protein n=1 Tax=Pedobacter namyangjuensis TaxID=600626 RepID=UPI0013B36356|nr:hypothetical protein [Pedobacter namyangjuensis]